MPIERSQFEHNAPGRLVDVPDGVPAFIPAPLPPEGLNPADYERVLGDAREAIGVLKGLAKSADIDPWLLTYPLFRREAIFSSQIEGTFTTPVQLALVDGTTADPEKSGGSEDAREVLNYMSAMDELYESVKAGHTLTNTTIRAAHSTLLANVRGHDKRGQYRTVQNFIGKEYEGIANARFVPAPPLEVQGCMDALIAHIATGMGGTSSLPILVDLALVHYQFETIHPFEDGNGRIGRMILPMLLILKKQLESPLLHLSAALERRKPEYMDRLLAVSQRGDWLGWVRFFLSIVTESAQDGASLVTSLSALRRDFKQRVAGKRVSSCIPQLIDMILQETTITFNTAKKRLNVTHAQASRHVRRLVKHGILKEVAGRVRNRIFLSPEVFAILTKYQRPKPPQAS